HGTRELPHGFGGGQTPAGPRRRALAFELLEPVRPNEFGAHPAGWAPRKLIGERGAKPAHPVCATQYCVRQRGQDRIANERGGPAAPGAPLARQSDPPAAAREIGEVEARCLEELIA